MKKVLIGCGIVIAIGLVLAAGCAVFGVYMAKQSFLTDDGEIRVLASEIMPYNLPGTGVGLFGLNIGMKAAVIANVKDNPTKILMLMSVPSSWKQDANRTARDMQRKTFDNMTIESTRTEDGVVAGVPAKIQIARGQATRKGKAIPIVNIQTVITRGDKQVMIMVIVLAPLGESDARTVLGSLRFPSGK